MDKLSAKLRFLDELCEGFHQRFMPNFQKGHQVLHYQVFGFGPEPVLAFHGFSRTLQDYAVYENFCSDQYTIYAVDLFYHGKSKIDGRKLKSFSKDALRELLQEFTAHLQLKRFSVIGYSMGGRIALFFLEQFPDQLNHLYLLAPDGLKNNFWHWLVTNTTTGKVIYGFTIKNSAWVGKVANAGIKMKVLPPKIDKFLALNFGTAGTRLRVYRVWKLYQHIDFDHKKLAKIVKHHQLPVDLVIGKKDPVISPALCKALQKTLGPDCTLHVIDAGHDLFKPHALEYLSEKVFSCS